MRSSFGHGRGGSSVSQTPSTFSTSSTSSTSSQNPFSDRNTLSLSTHKTKMKGNGKSEEKEGPHEDVVDFGDSIDWIRNRDRRRDRERSGLMGRGEGDGEGGKEMKKMEGGSSSWKLNIER